MENLLSRRPISSSFSLVLGDQSLSFELVPLRQPHRHIRGDFCHSSPVVLHCSSSDSSRALGSTSAVIKSELATCPREFSDSQVLPLFPGKKSCRRRIPVSSGASRPFVFPFDWKIIVCIERSELEHVCLSGSSS